MKQDIKKEVSYHQKKHDKELYKRDKSTKHVDYTKGTAVKRRTKLAMEGTTKTHNKILKSKIKIKVSKKK